jgi:hypothetical protein
MAVYWSACRFNYGFEFDAARAADTPYLRGFCPVAKQRRVFRNKVITDVRPVIAGYAFAEYGDAARWHQVARLPGFIGWLGGEFPEPCKRGVVEDLIARADDNWLMSFDDKAEDGPYLERGTCVLVALGSENCAGWSRRCSAAPARPGCASLGCLGAS